MPAHVTEYSQETYRERSTNCQLMTSPNIHEKRRDGNKDGSAHPDEREANRVDARYETSETVTLRILASALTLDHPLHLNLTCIHNTFDPLALPGEKLDELDSANELVQNAHALVAGS